MQQKKIIVILRNRILHNTWSEYYILTIKMSGFKWFYKPQKKLIKRKSHLTLLCLCSWPGLLWFCIRVTEMGLIIASIFQCLLIFVNICPFLVCLYIHIFYYLTQFIANFTRNLTGNWWRNPVPVWKQELCTASKMKRKMRNFV